MMNRVLGETARLGQSIWLDELSRELIDSGRLRQRVAEGLAGVTTNPAIFEKAIARGSDPRVARSGLRDPVALYEHLAFADVRDAADLLRPVHERTRGRDGYVSLEVPPALAHDRAGTVREALRLVRAIERPNLMIKVPATGQGLGAIAELTGHGVCVNATLIFSVASYRRVAEAHAAGLERWLAGGGDAARVASVASFFLSRIDTAIDRRLDALEGCAHLRGRTAIASARLAHAAYREMSAMPRWQALAARGARPQRLLWASTSTKNPTYPKLLYVENLVGPDTVNTLPEETYLEWCRSGEPRPTLEADAEGALLQLVDLEAAGIPLAEVAASLLDDGLRLFAEAFERLLGALARAGAQTGRP